MKLNFDNVGFMLDIDSLASITRNEIVWAKLI